jgi:hypothetical protein
MIGCFSQTSIRQHEQCDSVFVAIGVYYLGSKAEAAECATPSGAFPEPVLDPMVTIHRSTCACVPRAAARCRSAPLGRWLASKAEAVKPAMGDDELGWAVAGECRGP